MNRLGEELDYWHHPDLSSARDAVWAEPKWDDGVTRCLAQVREVLDDRKIDHGAAKPERVILDLGCGVGRLTNPLAYASPDISFVGVDISRSMLEHALAASDGLDNVEWLLGDGRTIPLDDDSVTGAYCVLLFQHLPPDAVRRYLGELDRVMKSGAKLRFQFVRGDGSEDGPFSFRHSLDDLLVWMSAGGFTVWHMDHAVVKDDWTWITATKG